MPVAATIHTPSGAAAFAKFFVLTWDWAYASTSTTYMRHYFVSSCVICKGVADDIDKSAAKGWVYVGDRFNVTSVAHPVETGATFVSTVSFDITAGAVVDKAGTTRDTSPPVHNYKDQVFMQWRAAAWTVTEVKPV